ncbi:MAG: bifunctional glutamate N-acetyltransferase/amino-acid acetyltransferase ArgJ [Acidimicrobiia bacterium]|nr:bifunctional glutamate N-acetyltransferase/amino-acid acetyltransferase ArgJ [Acidimicrobiia bacterium]MXZ86262.1 bifunctional glutamate N-acetyltransferase/amino-acid acetyltransferase ArgJ [Acidimicrobiia bacterium]MYB10739.1 bifunctional glutamate N-acetyltransferase/amino-acid acetyltransferase ArgJ [Acidimicrobiia bacterium]MYE73349.1 bifunctional glutamate N-acetyltransferase/amino-acid acetyltransferase ArgJ [Acidimicrobiia bacterium]MYG58218.1 bifunctional glutamate N-acetyltransfera
MSVTDVPGFTAAGVTCGIKPSGKPDLAIVATADGAAVSAAGVFTSNKMTAAPVLVCREHLTATGGKAAAVVLNSGNANAATGAQGMADAHQMCQETAVALGVAPEQVLVCSTGLIGYALPMDAVSSGITAAAQALTPQGGPQAAEAIMTTDTVPKQVVVASDGFTVGGIAKGAAMLEPNMATMLAVLVTDAAADPETLQQALRAGVSGTFNTLTVDGAESTNDTVLILANGQAGPIDPDALTQAIADACESLALQMADDAEGSTKTVFLRVTGAASDAEAAKAARDTANCQLVKCSWYGQDPYWGRIASEMGAAGVAFDHTKLTIAYGPHVVYQYGEPAHPPELAQYMTGRRLDLHVDLGMGDGSARIITTDLTHAYIDENMGTS